MDFVILEISQIPQRFYRPKLWFLSTRWLKSSIPKLINMEAQRIKILETHSSLHGNLKKVNLK
jgi:hypothetical protein